MTVLLFLIPIALAMGGLGLAAFLWALKSGQYEDMDGAAQRILFDDPADQVSCARSAAEQRAASGELR